MTEPQHRRLDDLTSVIAIARGLPTAKTTKSGDVPVLSIAMIRNRTDATHFSDDETVLSAGLTFAEPGDVLVAIEGGTVGETLVVPQDHPKFVPSQQAATLRVIDESQIDPWYLGAWMTGDAARSQVRGLARGAGIQRVPIKALGALTVPVVPLELQLEIANRFRAFVDSINGHRSVVACLEELVETDLAATFAELEPSEDGEPA